VNIVIYGLNYRPELVGVAKYTTEMAEWLASRGHQVTVITAPPHYPEWRVGEGYRRSAYRTEQLGNVTVRRCPMWLPRVYSPFKRIVSVVSFALSSFLPIVRAAFSRPDWLIVIEPSFFSVPGAWMAARLARVRLWLHVQDFELGAAASLGMVKGGGMLSVAAAIERWFLRRPDIVSTLSAPMLQRLADAGIPKPRRVLFPNWVDCEEIRPLATPSPYRAELGIAPESFVLLYSGSLGRKHGLEVAIEAARRLQPDRRFQLVFCGEGSERERLRALSKDLSNVIWLPLQPSQRLNDLLNLADVHLLPQQPSISSQVLPSKLIGMLASGRPVITTAMPGTVLADTVAQCGLVVRPNDPDAIGNAIVQLCEDDGLRRRFSASARLFAETHSNHDRILAKFERRLRDFAQHGAGHGEDA
jgi:colanic acid biosynthesis glycosyl transferase WcaI